MMYMNEYEINDAVDRFRHLTNPIPLRAAKFLAAFRDEVNSHSDGWAYWNAPVNSARKLMELCSLRDWMHAARMTEEEYKTALTPIKRFYTTKGNAAGLRWPNV